MEYLVVAVTGTDINLMNNKQRSDLIKYIIQELRVMRGLAYAVCRQMKMAKPYGIKFLLDSRSFFYPASNKETSDQRVKNILAKYKPKSKQK
jgi:hypothetical protein